MPVPESVKVALSEWSSFSGREETSFGGVEFEFYGLTPRLTPVDLGKERAQALKAYIDTQLRASNYFKPLRAMIFEVDGKARMMAVKYSFEDINSVFLYDISDIKARIYISGEHSIPELSNRKNGYQLSRDESGKQTRVTISDAGSGTLTLDIE